MTTLVPVFLSILLAQPSEAEKIGRLERSLENSRKDLDALRKELDDPSCEYQQAQADFATLDERRSKLTREMSKLRVFGVPLSADAREKEKALDALHGKWKLARERFDIAIQERKTDQERLASLQRKIQKDEQERDRLLAPSRPGLLDRLLLQGSGPAPPPTAEMKKEDRRKEDHQVAAAREQVQRAADVAREARERAQTLAERLDAQRQSIAAEEGARDTARRKADLARKTRHSLETELARAPEDERAGLRERITASDQRQAEAAAEERAATDRLADLQTELAGLQAEQLAALDEADRTTKAADDADRELASLEGVLAPSRILEWLKTRGPKLGLIVLAVVVLRRLARRGSRRIAGLVMHGTHSGRGGFEDRATTLAEVFRGTASLAILVGGALMFLEQLGVPVGPLLGGAAVLGLAVAFGAQNLVKDYFTGFMILMEDQYAVNDIIKVNGVGGKVEKITLRMTVLRDTSGVAHFIPHGSIGSVSNMSHGWSRAALDVHVSYHEDVDRVLDVLRRLCAELKEDPEFGPRMLEDAEILGVDAFTDSAVVLKFVIKTKPLEQWKVKRELLRRIKHRFDELRIEIPYPQRTIYHRHDDGAPLAA